MGLCNQFLFSFYTDSQIFQHRTKLCFSCHLCSNHWFLYSSFVASSLLCKLCLCLWHAANTTPYIWTHLKLDWETLWCSENGQLGQPINHWVKSIITKTVLNWGFPPQTQKHVPFLDFSFMQCTLKVLRVMLRFTWINHGVFKHPISCAVYLH